MAHGYLIWFRFLVILIWSEVLLGLPDTCAQAPTVTWNRAYGGSADDNLTSICPTADGGFLIGGASNSPASGDKTWPNERIDYWVVKLDANGQPQWNRTLGSPGNDYLQAVQQTPDGGYLLAGYSAGALSADKTQPGQGGDDYWLVRLDAQGFRLWDKVYGGSADDRLTSLCPTADGGFLLGGYSRSPVSGTKSEPNRGSSTTDDFWVVKIDSVGQVQWDHTYGTNDYDWLHAVVQLPDGGYLLGGGSQGSVSGERTQPTRGATDCWVVRLDAAGTKLWDRAYGGIYYDIVYQVRPTADGGFVLGGRSASPISGERSGPSEGSGDYWVLKVDAAGTKQWDVSCGSSGDDAVRALWPTPDGGYLVAGTGAQGYTSYSFYKTVFGKGAGDYWLLKLSSTGAWQWDQSYGGQDHEALAGLVPTADGGYVAAGTSAYGPSGDRTDPTRGGTDYWVCKLGGALVATRGAAAPAALEVYPNPARGQLTVRLPAAVPRAQLRLTLLDATGRVVATPAVPAGSGPELQLNVRPYPAGLYLLRLDGPNRLRAVQRVQLD